MNDSKLVQITKDQNGREIVMVRVDKTLKEMMEEKPSSRWDPEYWNPSYTNMERDLRSRFNCKTISDLQEFLTLGHVGKMQYIDDGEVPVIGVRDILATGIDPYSCRRIKKGGPIDLLKRRVQKGDLLFIRSGVGSVGRTVVVTDLFDLDLSISGDVYLLRSSQINLGFLAVYINSRFGSKQIKRIGSGVSGQIHLNFPEFGRVVVPLLNTTIQENIDSEYKATSSYHSKAICAKKRGDERGYKENLEKAEKMLKDLIKKTEEVIEGKRKDVN